MGECEGVGDLGSGAEAEGKVQRVHRVHREYTA